MPLPANLNINNYSVEWDNAGTTFNAIKVNVTDTNSASDSNFLWFGIGGSNKLRIKKDGFIVQPNLSSLASPALAFTDSGATGFFSPANGTVAYGSSSRGEQFRFSPNGNLVLGYASGTSIGFASSTSSGTPDLYIGRDSAGIAKITTNGTTLGGIKLGTASTALQVGTHSAIGAETVTGFITIKDSAGTDRKIAVVS